MKMSLCISNCGVAFPTVANKHQVTTIMLNELYPELALTVKAYEKLTETVGMDSTLTIFWEQVNVVRKDLKKSKKMN